MAHHTRRKKKMEKQKETIIRVGTGRQTLFKTLKSLNSWGGRAGSICAVLSVCFKASVLWLSPSLSQVPQTMMKRHFCDSMLA